MRHQSSRDSVYKMAPLIGIVMLLAALSSWAEVVEPELSNRSAPLGSLLPESGELERTSEKIEMLDSSEFKPEVQQLPQLVEKLRVEEFLASSPYVILPHRPNYLLPLSWQRHPNNAPADLMHQNISDDPQASHGQFQHYEAVFQLSIKARIASGVLGKLSRLEMAYTNRSFWQSYNGSISRPFRETNHEPELILSWPTQNKYLDYLAVSLNHQSNGQSGNLSRSWNRTIISAGTIFPFGVLHTRYWYRLPEKKRTDPNSTRGDDNPDITHFMGHGELHFIYAMGRNNFSVMVRNNLKFSDNKGALELNWSFPINKRLKGMVQYFDGYGDSLIDYNHKQQRLSFGIQLSDWL